MHKITLYFHYSVTEISVSRIFKLWLQPEFLFRLSSYSKKFEKSLEIMESVSKNVSSGIRYFVR